uniref:Uncharacterized protein n=1 Tax=Pristionchus pacificus TaxID=54126 RepID=A0A2A6D1U7_PRIPA|eukprot:PDM84277.1 hypothetical protein PRIPAC_33300 [Pristionchus pacificus]
MSSDAVGIRLAGCNHPRNKPPPYCRAKTTCAQSSTSQTLHSPYPPSTPSSPSSPSLSSSINDKAESVGDKQSNGMPTAAPLRPRYVKNRKDKRAKVKISNPGPASASSSAISSYSGSPIVTDV